jgi:hypothetical protein
VAADDDRSAAAGRSPTPSLNGTLTTADVALFERSHRAGVRVAVDRDCRICRERPPTNTVRRTHCCVSDCPTGCRFHTRPDGDARKAPRLVMHASAPSPGRFRATRLRIASQPIGLPTEIWSAARRGHAPRSPVAPPSDAARFPLQETASRRRGKKRARRRRRCRRLLSPTTDESAVNMASQRATRCDADLGRITRFVKREPNSPDVRQMSLAVVVAAAAAATAAS